MIRTLWTALRHPIAVRRLARTMGETQRREAIRYAHEHREYEAAVARQQATTGGAHHVTLTREHLALLSADADA